MAATLGKAFTGSIDLLVGRVIVPVTSVIPILVRTGLLLAGFAALWLAFLAAMAVQPSALDDAWRSIGGLPLAAQGLAWLLFLPLMGGLWAWSTDWPLIVRVAVVVSIAAWNLLVFIPRRESVAAAAQIQ
jgi:hypothetical protein